jgi:hypothetical protein
MLKRSLTALFLLAGFQANASIISDYGKTDAASDGWSVLYQGTFNELPNMASILGGIASGTTYALASSSSTSTTTYDLFGSTSTNLLDIRGTTRNATTSADGAFWYWNNYTAGAVYGSLGFSDVATISQSSADIIAGDLRMSWHTINDSLRTGYRSGVNMSLQGAGAGDSWQRYVLVQSDVPEPSIIALFGLGLVGIGFSRKRKAQS